MNFVWAIAVNKLTGRPTFPKSNAWGFRILITRIFEKFLTTSEHSRRYSDVFWRLLNVAVQSSKSLRDLDRLLFRTQTRHEAPFVGIFSGNWIEFLLLMCFKKKKSSGFVSQAWEIDLDVWGRCLWSTGVRLRHNACELAGIQALL